MNRNLLGGLLLRTVGVFLILGLIAGFIAGLLGVGGGIFMVPAMVYFFQMDQKIAQCTSLAVIIPISIAATIRYHLEHRVNWPVAFGLAVGGMIGSSLLAPPVVGHVDSLTLRKVFGVFMIITGLHMTGALQWLWSLLRR